RPAKRRGDRRRPRPGLGRRRRPRRRDRRAWAPPRGRPDPRAPRARPLDAPSRRQGRLRREVLAGARGRGSQARRRARHVEDGPLPPQAQDARGRDPSRRRGERPHVLRRGLLRRRRRDPRRVQGGGDRRAPPGSRVDALRLRAAPVRHPRAEGALPRRREVQGDRGARPRPQGALRDHRHRRRARALSRRRLGPRARVQHQPVPDAALRGQDRARDRGHEARHLRRAPPLPVRHAAVVVLAAVLFDLDGTLVNTLAVCYLAFRRALQRAGATPLSDAEIHALFGPSEDGMMRRVLPETWQSALPGYFEEYERLLPTCPTVIPELGAALALLRERRIPTGLVTGKSHVTAAVSLRHFGLDDAFDAVEQGPRGGAAKAPAIGLLPPLWGLVPAR